MKQFLTIFPFLAALALCGSCTSSKEAVATSPTSVVRPTERFVSALRPVYIYRTNADYSHLVPVQLDENRQKVVSYPDPVDVGEFCLPVALDKGYLYDRRGLGANSAFTSYTYEEYAKLTQVPTRENLLNSIVAKYPLLELWDCTKQYNQLMAQQKGEISASLQYELLNSIIASGFQGCKQLLDIEME